MPVYPYQLADGSTRWFFIVDLPASTEGRRRQRKKRGFTSEKAAAKAEGEAVAAFQDVTLAADGSVAAELEAWLPERELDVQETTVANYRDVIRCYVTPNIGTRQVYTIDKRVLHDLYRTLEQRGGGGGGALSRMTVRIVHRVLIKAFKDLGVLLDGVRKPRPAQREGMGRRGVWTPGECTQFFDHHVENRLRAAWVLAVVVGLRRGKLAGLKWHRVDLDRGLLLGRRIAERTNTIVHWTELPRGGHFARDRGAGPACRGPPALLPRATAGTRRGSLAVRCRLGMTRLRRAISAGRTLWMVGAHDSDLDIRLCDRRRWLAVSARWFRWPMPASTSSSATTRSSIRSGG